MTFGSSASAFLVFAAANFNWVSWHLASRSAPKRPALLVHCTSHYERMLYDESQLARLYVEAWQVTGDAEFRRVAEEILDYVIREMTDPSGGFYSTQDADSEGEEGKFFVWEPKELEELLGSTDARLVAAYYDVTQGGNFEGKNILHVDHDVDDRCQACWRHTRPASGSAGPQPAQVVRRAGEAGEAGSRREGADRMERHDAAGVLPMPPALWDETTIAASPKPTPSSCCASSARPTAGCCARGRRHR